jgi:hypothetical protein
MLESVASRLSVFGLITSPKAVLDCKRCKVYVKLVTVVF